MFTNSKLTKGNCRRCGKNTLATTRCPNVARLDAPVHPPLVTDASIASAAKIAADAAKRAVEAAKRAAAKEARRAAKETRRAFKVAVFESLEPFGVKVCNRTYFRGSNWDTESVNLFKKCGEPEPKNGCWCMQHN